MKYYPKTVTLRKSLSIFATVVLISILLLIFYNLRTSKKEKTRVVDESETGVRMIANKSDTEWFNQKPSIKKAVSKSTANKITKKSDTNKNLSIPMENNPSDSSSVYAIRSPEEEQKSMLAPISSKQLIGEISKVSKDEKNILKNENSNSNYITAKLENPISPYEVKAGTVIPCTLIRGINSDLPGTISAQVQSPVYDSIAHKYLLIPQGAKLEGVYESKIIFGQERLLIVWNRIIFPNGQSINLEGMPGVDLSGYAGLKDKVNHHYFRIFSSALLMSVLSAGAQLSQTPTPQKAGALAQPTVNQVMTENVATHLIETAISLTNKNLNMSPTLEIRPGMEFYISVTKDMVFPGPYSHEVRIDAKH